MLRVALASIVVLTGCTSAAAPSYSSLCDLPEQPEVEARVTAQGVVAGERMHGWTIGDESCWRGIPIALNGHASAALETAISRSETQTGLVRANVEGTIAEVGGRRTLLIKAVSQAEFQPMSEQARSDYWSRAVAQSNRRKVR